MTIHRILLSTARSRLPSEDHCNTGCRFLLSVVISTGSVKKTSLAATGRASATAPPRAGRSKHTACSPAPRRCAHGSNTRRVSLNPRNYQGIAHSGCLHTLHPGNSWRLGVQPYREALFEAMVCCITCIISFDHPYFLVFGGCLTCAC